VTKAESIAAAIEASGPVDVLVNSAGIGVVGVFAAFGCGRERDLERDAGADAPGGRLHCEQDGDRGVHRIARPRAGDVRLRVTLVEPGYGPTTRFTSNGGSRMEGLFPGAISRRRSSRHSRR
jgi:hypothetical protein